MAIDIEDDIVQDFLVESREILDALGEQLVELEQRPQDKDLLNAVFRGFHTIKGGAGFLALDPLVEVCHRTEDLFNLLRSGEKAVTADLMDTVLKALDVVIEQFGTIENGGDPQPASPELLAMLDRLNVPDAEAPPAAEALPADTPPAQGGGDDISDQEFEALLDALEAEKAGAAKPVEPPPPADKPAAKGSADEISEEEFEALLDELHGPGGPKGAAAPPKTPEKPAASGSSDEITDDEFEALLDDLHGKGKAPEPKAPAAGSQGKSAGQAADQAPSQPPAAGSTAPVAKAQSPAKPDAAPAEAEQRKAGPKGDTTVRVDTAKLDDIMNLVGELVLVRNRLSTLRGQLADEHLGAAVGDLELVTADLQSAVMKTRMQPIKKVFGRFPRLIRDLARNMGKHIDLEMRGEDTDLDKNLVEALADPLIHLVRNSVDHGIEEPADREMTGKSRVGKVLLSAEQEGDHILLIISDDGKGMDAEMLRRKVVEKGLMDQESANRLDEHDCYNLIFLPGFSTKAEISDISGRGVGMDVVKTRISQLNGTIDIDSELGRGTTFRIKVPLTLAILPTLMVKVQDRKFALPMSVVREIFELQENRTNVVDGRLVVMVRRKAMPLFFLERWLGHQGDPVVREHDEQELGDERQVVTVVMGNQAVGFVVDEVIGLEEVVIKPLGAMLHGLPGLAGSTITGDGRIALIVDIPSLIKAYGTRM
ncbi:chemotaxis protein CheA [Alkalilimnicola sp. S0819]|uniref:chemotaxis protein CheA n=1 Tax=Alkalilimnicola sp. S0819 TaxID=2613922 RepID=UPI0012622059|nr:chemotaxis protein CheA [Alkalilimnicola sp. S0819]KAB7627162.1 chemotaxis protein CheA [Alkalilimnicola sp. S0819]MPQ15871.1 chemotaxis protein CheA [Alkalilimnicola sp. S0819]